MLYTIDDVAKMLGMNPRTIRRYIEKGQLRGERIGGSWRISEEAVKDMVDAPEMKEALSQHFQERSDDMLDLYLQGKHRLQQNNNVIMLVFAFNPQTEAWVLAKMDEWMTELNRMGQDAQFDFTMVGNEQGLYRIVLIAPFMVARTMIGELERLREGTN